MTTLVVAGEGDDATALAARMLPGPALSQSLQARGDFYREVGNRVRLYRQRFGASQRALAEAAGLPAASISRFECHGTKLRDGRDLVRICLGLIRIECAHIMAPLHPATRRRSPARLTRRRDA